MSDTSHTIKAIIKERTKDWGIERVRRVCGMTWLRNGLVEGHAMSNLPRRKGGEAD